MEIPKQRHSQLTDSEELHPAKGFTEANAESICVKTSDGENDVQTFIELSPGEVLGVDGDGHLAAIPSVEIDDIITLSGSFAQETPGRDNTYIQHITALTTTTDPVKLLSKTKTSTFFGQLSTSTIFQLTLIGRRYDTEDTFSCVIRGSFTHGSTYASFTPSTLVRETHIDTLSGDVTVDLTDDEEDGVNLYLSSGSSADIRWAATLQHTVVFRDAGVV